MSFKLFKYADSEFGRAELENRLRHIIALIENKDFWYDGKKEIHNCYHLKGKKEISVTVFAYDHFKTVGDKNHIAAMYNFAFPDKFISVMTDDEIRKEWDKINAEERLQTEVETLIDKGDKGDTLIYNGGYTNEFRSDDNNMEGESKPNSVKNSETAENELHEQLFPVFKDEEFTIFEAYSSLENLTKLHNRIRHILEVLGRATGVIKCVSYNKENKNIEFDVEVWKDKLHMEYSYHMEFPLKYLGKMSDEEMLVDEFNRKMAEKKEVVEKKMVNICDERPKNEPLKFTRVELYLLFSTDCDFHVNLDGLETFIRGHLGENVRKFDFRAEMLSTPKWGFDDQQFIRLSVSLPWESQATNEDSWVSGLVHYRQLTWADEAIKQVILPAYMWIFAEIGVGNGHGLSTYFRTWPFDVVQEPTGYFSFPTWKWPKSAFTDGVKLSPRCKIMSGNYEDGWAQWRFVLNGAKNYGNSDEYVQSVKKMMVDCPDD